MIPWLLAVTLVASVYPNRLYEYACLAVTLAAMAVTAPWQLRWKPPNLNLLLALAGLGLLGTWWSRAPVTALGVEWVLAALWYWIMAMGMRVPGGRRGVGIGIGLATFAYAAWAAWDYARGDYRVAGPTTHPNILALLANIWMPLLLLWGLRAIDERRWLGWGAVAAGVTLAGVVLVTLSRTGIAAMALNLALVAALRWRSSRRALAAIGLAVVALLVMTGPAIVRRQLASPRSNLLARVTYDRLAWAMLRDHPLGVGTGRFAAVSNEPPYQAMRWPYPEDIAHLALGQIGAECGWLGLAVCLLLWWRLVRLAWHARRQVVQQGVLLGYLALFITGAMESVMWLEPCNLAWLTVAAISVGTAGDPAP